jgi:biopolymer transport protein TolQ
MLLSLATGHGLGHVLGYALGLEVAASEVLDPMSLLLGASGPVFVILWCLLAAAAGSWMVIVVKLRQLSRWEAAELRLAATVGRQRDAEQLVRAAVSCDALGAVVLRELLAVRAEPDLLAATSERALTLVQQQMGKTMTFLSSVAAVSPFVGLLGTVYGILDAFLRIGREQSASLPVVAPAIGEALIVTAVGLFAAIPAVIAYNFLGRRLDDLLASIRGSAGVWIQILQRGS